MASAATTAPPTAVISCAKDRKVATHRPSSKAPRVRARSMYEARSAISSSELSGARRNPVFRARVQSAVSAAVMGRTAMSVWPVMGPR
jgi:hypothetical protein